MLTSPAKSRRRLQVLLTATAFGVCALATSAEASILVGSQLIPGDFGANFDAASFELADDQGAGATAPSTATPSNQRSTPPAGIPAPPDSQASFTLLKYNAPNGSSSSSSSSSTGACAGAPTSIALFTAPSVPHNDLCAWLCGEKQFSLPDSPGLDLLRPPRL